jgi:hypothetical protein
MIGPARYGKLERSAPSLQADRRLTERHSCALEAFFRPLGTGGAWLWWLATVRDVSVKGIGLTVTCRVEAGTLLSVELQNADETFRRTLLVRVVYVLPHEERTGWSVGAAFTQRLTDGELQALLQ